MTHYASAKDCLLKHGKIQEITRGRISAVNHKFLADRIAQGDTIAGYEVQVSTKPTGQTVHSNKVAPVSTEKVIADIPFPTRDENALEAFIWYDGKQKDIGIRTICTYCRASYTYCPCPTPGHRVDTDAIAPVYFKERKTPLKTGWYR